MISRNILGGVADGMQVIIKWRGKPVFIRHRTAAEIDEANSINVASLRDPETDDQRVKKPEWLVMLGMSPEAGWHVMGDGRITNGPDQASAHIWVACPSARPATSADGSAPATVPTTTFRAASGKDPPRSTSRSLRTTSLTTASWLSVKRQPVPAKDHHGPRWDRDGRIEKGNGGGVLVQYGVSAKQKRAFAGFPSCSAP